MVISKFEKVEKAKINQQIADKAEKKASSKAAEEAAAEKALLDSGLSPEEVKKQMAKDAKKKAHAAKRAGAKLEHTDGHADIKSVQQSVAAREAKRLAAIRLERKELEEQRELERAQAKRRSQAGDMNVVIPPPLWPSLDRLVEAGLIERKKFSLVDLFRITKKKQEEASTNLPNLLQVVGAESAAAIAQVTDRIGQVSKRISTAIMGDDDEPPEQPGLESLGEEPDEEAPAAAPATAPAPAPASAPASAPPPEPAPAPAPGALWMPEVDPRASSVFV